MMIIKAFRDYWDRADAAAIWFNASQMIAFDGSYGRPVVQVFLAAGEDPHYSVSRIRLPSRVFVDATVEDFCALLQTRPTSEASIVVDDVRRAINLGGVPT